MLELQDIAVIFGLLFVSFLIFIRLLVAVLKRLLPQMVPELMGNVAANIPNVSPKQLVGLFGMEFIKQGGMHMIMQKFGEWVGMPKQPQPPRLPPGGQ